MVSPCLLQTLQLCTTTSSNKFSCKRKRLPLILRQLFICKLEQKQTAFNRTMKMKKAQKQTWFIFILIAVSIFIFSTCINNKEEKKIISPTKEISAKTNAYNQFAGPKYAPIVIKTLVAVLNIRRILLHRK